MTIATVNPFSWGEPAYVVTMQEDIVIEVLESTASSLVMDIDFVDYEIKEYPVGVRLERVSVDAYPEDDPGYCYYERFEPIIIKS